MARKRKKNTRIVKPKIYIFCEGEKTEPAYIRAYINFKYPKSARLRDVERPIVLKDTNKNTPVQLVEEALKHKETLSFEKDEVWVVYDRESSAKYSDELHSQALNNAKRNNINVAISNVCFEYWLLLHLSNSAQANANCDSLIKSSTFVNSFKQIGVASYNKKDKSANYVAELLMKDEYLSAAITNAEKNNLNAINSSQASESEPYKIQPYTNVHKLLSAIDDIALYK